MQIKTVEQLILFKIHGKTRIPTGEPNMYKVIYQYELEELDPLFNFWEKVLGEGYYRDKPTTP